jgi:hypothetical protein
MPVFETSAADQKIVKLRFLRTSSARGFDADSLTWRQ